jgi:hypothetical protein
VNADITTARWRKSSYSSGSGGNCVEVARNLPGVVGVRDSKNPDGPVLLISFEGWQALTRTIKNGELDLP